MGMRLNEELEKKVVEDDEDDGEEKEEERQYSRGMLKEKEE